MSDSREGNRIEAVWQHANNQVATLFATQKVHRLLYNDEERVRIMNNYAAEAFNIIQSCLIYEQVRVICSLTEERKTGKHENASLLGLAALIPEPQVPPIVSMAAKVKTRLDTASESIEKIRIWRHKRLMHFDLETIAAPVRHEGPTFKQLREARKAIADSMNLISDSLQKGYWSYENVSLNGSEGGLEWLFSDANRFSILHRLVLKKQYSDSIFCQLFSNRSNRWDSRILGTSNAASPTSPADP